MSRPVAFEPTKLQRIAKARLWSKLADNPLLEVSQLTDAEIERMAETGAVHTWKEDPEFVRWFVNDKAVEIAIEAGTEKAVQRLLDIIEATPEARGTITTTHQLAAVKLLLEYSSAKAPEDESKPLTAEDLPDDEKKLLELIKKAALPVAVQAVPDE